MPLPTPQPDEDHDEFMDRCMADPTMNKEYPKEDQRYAVCESQWDAEGEEDSKHAVPSGLQVRYVPTDVRIRKRGKNKRLIVGYGAVFYDGTPNTEFSLWAGEVERILPCAFDRAIDEDDVRGLFNHDPNQVLGRTSAGTMRLSVDDKGLAYEIEPGDTTVGRDVMAHIERRDVTGSSFSFVITDSGWKKESGVHVNEIRGVKLYDTGPVTFPAYTATEAGVRSDITAIRKSYDAWRATLPPDLPAEKTPAEQLAELEARINAMKRPKV